MAAITTKYPFAGCIETRQGGRNENQDNAGFVDTPLGLLLLVCDGMGGGPGGRTASLMAVDTILSLIQDVSPQTPRKEALRFAIERANDLIYSESKEKTELRGMGTTVAAMLINEDSAIIAHDGDTRIYQLRKGSILFRSADHSAVADLVRQKKLTEEEARNHPRSNVITRALGVKPNIEIEYDEVTFQRGDRFVICSDGIWGALPQEALIQMLSRTTGINELTQQTVEEVDALGRKNGGKHDNLTLAVLDCPFDSNLKKIKKEEQKSGGEAENDISATSQKKRRRLFSILLVLLILIIVGIVLLLTGNRQKEDHQKEELRPETTDNPSTERTGDVPEQETTDETPSTIDEVIYVLNHTDWSYENTIGKDTSAIDQAINKVVKDLDSLKIITGPDKARAEKRKERFIDGTIIPDVRELEWDLIIEVQELGRITGTDTNDQEKSITDDIDNIKKMLKSPKTVLSSKNGRPTDEGNEQINNIRAIVNSLKNQ